MSVFAVSDRVSASQAPERRGSWILIGFVISSLMLGLSAPADASAIRSQVAGSTRGAGPVRLPAHSTGQLTYHHGSGWVKYHGISCTPRPPGCIGPTDGKTNLKKLRSDDSFRDAKNKYYLSLVNEKKGADVLVSGYIRGKHAALSHHSKSGHNWYFAAGNADNAYAGAGSYGKNSSGKCTFRIAVPTPHSVRVTFTCPRIVDKVIGGAETWSLSGEITLRK